MESAVGWNIMFCPWSIINELMLFGALPSSDIFTSSHKCQFRHHHVVHGLMIFSIKQNTYKTMAKRTFRGEVSTVKQLHDSIDSFIFALNCATILYEQYFRQHYKTIKQGLYNLIICYSSVENGIDVFSKIVTKFPCFV